MFDRENSNENILVFKVEDFDTIDDFTFNMIKANPIDSAITIGIDSSNLLLAISNLVPLDSYLRKTPLTIDAILEQYNSTKDKLESYMIPSEELILNYEYTYVDPESGEVRFPLVPTEYSYFETHTEKEFILCVKDALGPEVKVKKKKKEEKPKVAKRSLRERMRDVVMSGSGDDMFEFESDGMLPEGVNVIKVRSTGAEYPLLFGPDTIGTDESRCSIPFSGNAEMEAEHCVITLGHGKYNLSDLNSKSGTFLNGLRLEPGKTYELSSADLITVAGEDLVFSRRS
ncbi:MAG: FHA domain-containing protein [Clostridia bacterium]|nr:FHA domain-containing protein [Clostridia bacterium]